MNKWLAWLLEPVDSRTDARLAELERHLQAVEEHLTLLGERLCRVEAGLDAIADFEPPLA